MPAEREHNLAVCHQGFEHQREGAAAVMSQKVPPLPPDPREDGYDYRLDVSIGDKKDDRFWGEEIVKPSRKLSFERDIRVQEFEKERSSCEVRKLVRSPETKARATEPSLESSGSVSQKSRRSRHKKRKKRKSKKKKKKKKKKKRSRDESSTTATTGETTESREDQSLGASLSQLVSSAAANIFTAAAPASPPMDERAMDAAVIEPAGVVQPTDVTATEPLPRKRKRDKQRRSSREDDSAAICMPASGGEAMGYTDMYSQRWTPDTIDWQGDYRQPRYLTQGTYDQRANDSAAYATTVEPYQHALDIQRLEAGHLNRLYQQMQQLRGQLDMARQQIQDYLGGREDGTFSQESFKVYRRGLTTAPPVVTVVEKPTAAVQATEGTADDTTGQEVSSTNTVLLGEVGTLYGDTSSMPAQSKYTESPGAQTVVEMVQDCFQAMDGVTETGICSTLPNYTEVQGAETVVRMVHDCFQDSAQELK
ncbi:hypothetical protein HPB52_008164 [Rhipicephalus sanguineus]|uniref:Uncharacterized protein n=1 Tax=Rhipicephalus sanguineus TaxID=34632 RepID=A0A9D4PYX5_RHISA|nr:hypothetical protein HPB52_008164 [Rhipicephalus sanguineus]